MMQGKYNLCSCCECFIVWDQGWWDRASLGWDPRWYCNDCWHRWLSITHIKCKGCHGGNMYVQKKDAAGLKGYCLNCWDAFGVLPCLTREPCQCPKCERNPGMPFFCPAAYYDYAKLGPFHVHYDSDIYQF